MGPNGNIENTIQTSFDEYWFKPNPNKEGFWPPLGETPFVAEIIRRLLDRWALGEEIDPWLPFPKFFWKKPSVYPPNYSRIGRLRLLWASYDSQCKPTCGCGSNCYSIGFEGWINNSTGFFVCIGCSMLLTKPMPGGFGNPDRPCTAPLSAFPSWRREREPKTADFIRLLDELRIVKRPEGIRALRSIIKKDRSKNHEK